MYFDFAVSSRTWESAVVAASVLKMSILNGQDSLSSIGKNFISSCFYDLFIPFVPNHFCSRLGDFTNQFYSVCFTNFNVAKIFCKDSFFLCKNCKNIELTRKLFFSLETYTSAKKDFTLTQYGQHARSSCCPYFTGIFCLITQ